jgi:hypothetical protein
LKKWRVYYYSVNCDHSILYCICIVSIVSILYLRW